jgi:hypothetical protein
VPFVSVSEMFACSRHRGSADRRLHLFAIDRASKFAVTQLVDKANTQTPRAFLEALVAIVPYTVEIVH